MSEFWQGMYFMMVSFPRENGTTIIEINSGVIGTSECERCTLHIILTMRYVGLISR